ncbi:MAG: hypothetical protein AVDCRST_MAG30-3416 [uncultured Solirubrobacteraceae bacterium]|uniref:Peptidase C-terminal archaeal/bacterial domain-containing protein n=1 Tax=uncultured Solirubrobacteraceae bacterium TaxID=1162706 RepID=A0A6J4TKS3_9ACTN|nr:MAG: hypothetical protein AVDCRST_MAG30-3416 [uncultured Solirubrobacteraceae bacterium]
MNPRTPVAIAALLVSLAVPGVAQAAPPPNDNRASAQTIADVPASVRGTTVDATLEPDEPQSCRGTTKGSVFYAFRSGQAGDLVLTLDAGGDLDAVVDVYRRTRSQLMPVACGVTDEEGDALLEIEVDERADYLVRVAPLANAIPADFTLGLVRPDAPDRAPGAALPAGGVDRSLDAILNPDDTWAVSLSAGRTYRLNVVSTSEDAAVPVSLYPPGTRSFSGARPVRTLRGTQYVLFTPGPGEGGRYTLRARAARGVKGAQPYHLQVGRAGSDDTAPGRFLGNDREVSAVLEGHKVDVVDLYRFGVSRRSDLTVTLAGSGFEAELLTDAGRRVATISQEGEDVPGLAARIKPGRYFIAVRATGGAFGRYKLRRLARTITRTSVRVDRRTSTTVRPGSTVRLGTRVSPAVAGPVTLVVQRFDPLAGWQFAQRYQVQARDGLAAVRFRPGTVGRWRVRATYEGTRRVSPSESGYARFLVASPLRRR